MNTDTAVLDHAVEQLKLDWDQLSDIDRAQRIVDIKKSGLSIRKIAESLGRSESLLRHLRRTLLAPAADQAAAQQGRISTNELVRRGKAEVKRQAKKAQKAAQQEQERQASEGAKLIDGWLRRQNITGPFAEQAVDTVRTKLVLDEAAGIIPQMSPPPGFPVDVIIERCRPRRSADDEQIHPLGWHVEWRARWLVCAFPDSNLRYCAIELALRETQKR